MRRREFCKLVAAAAAGTAVAGSAGASELKNEAGSSATATSEGVAAAQSSDAAAAGFGAVTQSYAEFCGMPASERVFYALEDGKVISEKLNESDWKPTGWIQPPDLPIPGGSWDGVPLDSPVTENLAGEGPFKPTWDSLLGYEAPEWYRDAKFGIWAHWSPQCVPEASDWYARNMYIEGERQYKYQLDHYGPPSRFGFKEICPQWTLLNWEPEELIARYKKAGAKIFVALANHHDGLDCWNSRHHPWNSVNIGPHRDVVGTWAKVARDAGLRLGVTVHQARNWWWFQTTHGADTKGPLAGVPYDGIKTLADGKGQWWEGYDPQRVYAPKHPYNALPDASFAKNFYDRTKDLIDQHDPDLLYFDNPRLPLGWAGMNIGAYYYNRSLRAHGGTVQGVITIKEVPEQWVKAAVVDYERGLTDKVMQYAWQSETCIGDWHYNRALYDKPGEFGGYLPPRDVIHWLIDTVSKNGTFILNVPGKPDGTIDSKEIAVVDRITDWMGVNGEAIYATRPWNVYGEGPNAIKAGSFQGNSVSQLGEKDIRFTRSKDGKDRLRHCAGVACWRSLLLQSLGTGRMGRWSGWSCWGLVRRCGGGRLSDGLRVTRCLQGVQAGGGLCGGAENQPLAASSWLLAAF
jgi:alpha-L-fucosidase